MDLRAAWQPKSDQGSVAGCLGTSGCKWDDRDTGSTLGRTGSLHATMCFLRVSGWARVHASAQCGCSVVAMTEIPQCCEASESRVSVPSSVLRRRQVRLDGRLDARGETSNAHTP